jgi:predicted acylesterase/phospholipase RssA
MTVTTELVPRGTDAPQASARVQPITLALQGGGSLGAFAWGVLDRLLDEPSLHIEVVSGASAGAMNAALLVQGLATGGPSEAKRLLETFWRRVAAASGSPDIGGAAGWLFPFAEIMAPMADALRQATKGMAQNQLGSTRSARCLRAFSILQCSAVMAFPPSSFRQPGSAQARRGSFGMSK